MYKKRTFFSRNHYMAAFTFASVVCAFSPSGYSYYQPNSNCASLYGVFHSDQQPSAKAAYQDVLSRNAVHNVSQKHAHKHHHAASLAVHAQKVAEEVTLPHALGEDAQMVSNADLSEMRGGFISAGGFTLNFGLTTTTTIDGMVQSTLNLTSDTLHGAVPTNLQQLIQTGQKNQAVTPANVANNVLTVVQNTANNQVIQNSNVLNMTVNNVNTFRFQQALFNSRLSGVMALH